MSISFDPDRQRELIRVLTAAADAIDGELATLERSVASVRGAWTGEAQRAYERAQREWSASKQRTRAALKSATASAAAAGEALTQADKDVGALFE